MECPVCKSKLVVKAKCKSPIYARGKIIAYKPQFTCIKCDSKWDEVVRK